MYFPATYGFAVFLCVITMICWGSWANTQKLASQKWSFQLFYWDYSLGIVILSLLMALTMGSMGTEGRPFLTDIGQADSSSFLSAFLGGVIFNIANLLLVAAIDLTGMAIAFPVGIGLALVIGVIVNYLDNPIGDPILLFTGVALVSIAIILDAIAYRNISADKEKTPFKGVVIALLAGVLMGFFYRFVADSMSLDFQSPAAGKFTPYTALVVFSIGIFISNFLWNTIFMYKPVKGERVSYADYFTGSAGLHLVGILGGVIWCIGMGLSLIASGEAGFAISYGLGQGATMVAAFWGVFIWKEFSGASSKTNILIGLMFLCFIAGLVLIIFARG